ncbi:hypothetical protein [Vibrio phage RYC]|nr:hypothetical protein [Vibrio phage RYC]
MEYSYGVDSEKVKCLEEISKGSLFRFIGCQEIYIKSDEFLNQHCNCTSDDRQQTILRILDGQIEHHNVEKEVVEVAPKDKVIFMDL